jgi:hypothetical protein
MKIRLLFLGGLLLVAGFLAGKLGTREVHAQGVVKYVVPKAWGHYAGSVSTPMGSMMVYEGSDGVVRFSDMKGNLQAEIDRN